MRILSLHRKLSIIERCLYRDGSTVFVKHAYVVLASHADVFEGARFSSLPTNACSAGNIIPFPLFYLRLWGGMKNELP